MELQIILQADTLEELQLLIEQHFQQKIRIHQEELSMFEQYQVRSAERTFIPKIWKYRIICKNARYYFGET